MIHCNFTGIQKKTKAEDISAAGVSDLDMSFAGIVSLAVAKFGVQAVGRALGRPTWYNSFAQTWWITL